MLDSNDTLQALRTELRPDRPEVDGILGANALHQAEIDIDYVNDRMLARCTAAAPACQARPEIIRAADRTQINGCLGL